MKTLGDVLHQFSATPCVQFKASPESQKTKKAGPETFVGFEIKVAGEPRKQTQLLDLSLRLTVA